MYENIAMLSLFLSTLTPRLARLLVPGKSRVNRKSRYLKSGYSTMYLYSTTHYVLHFSSLLLAGGYSYLMLIVLLLLMTLEFTLGGIIFNKVQKSQ